MSVPTFSVLIGLGSFIAGLLGSLTGLGGGVIMIPLLTLVFGVDMHYAMGASLVSVIATSSGSAAAYVREGYSDEKYCDRGLWKCRLSPLSHSVCTRRSGC